MIEWKIIKDFPQYMISSDGNVKHIKHNKVLKTFKNNKGYMTVRIYNNKIAYTKRIHRLVAEAFIPNPENKSEIDHINTIKTDNRVENLRWVTSKENSNNNLTKIHINNRNLKADNNGKSKKIKILDIVDDITYSYNCIREAAECLSINYSTLRSAFRNNSIINKKYKII